MQAKIKLKSKVELTKEAKELFATFQNKPLKSGQVFAFEHINNIGTLVHYSSKKRTSCIHIKFLRLQPKWCDGFNLQGEKKDDLALSQMAANAEISSLAGRRIGIKQRVIKW